MATPPDPSLARARPRVADLPDDPLARLLAIMAHLRDRTHGCAWDLRQDFASIAPYTIEEAYEVADAIGRDDLPDLKEELGDLLLQVVFHSQLAAEIKAFDFNDVAAGIAEKMVARHPHVFGDAGESNWEALKALERARKPAKSPGDRSLLDGIALALPALLRAEKLQKRAARVGFDWPDLEPVFDKILEEINELKDEIKVRNAARLSDEIGDILFAVANLARHLDVDPEAALRSTNDKFQRRFGHIERTLAAAGRTPADADLAEMERLWVAAKALEKN